MAKGSTKFNALDWLLTKVSAEAFRLAWLMMSRYDMARGTFPKQETLAADLGCSERWVRNLIRELESVGFLITTRTGKRKSNSYTIAHGDRNATSGHEGSSDRNDTSGHKGQSERKSTSGHKPGDRNNTSGDDRNNTSGQYESPVIESPVREKETPYPLTCVERTGTANTLQRRSLKPTPRSIASAPSTLAASG
jgi:hypothetical protein